MDRLKRHLVAAVTASLSGRTTVPAGGELLWQWFIELGRARTYHASGPNPIAYAEISAWASLQRWPIAPRHVEILRAMDDAWLNAFYETRKRNDGVKKLPQKSAHAISTETFDAIFG